MSRAGCPRVKRLAIEVQQPPPSLRRFRPAEQLLRILGDRYAIGILEAVAERPRSQHELVAVCEDYDFHPLVAELTIAGLVAMGRVEFGRLNITERGSAVWEQLGGVLRVARGGA